MLYHYQNRVKMWSNAQHFILKHMKKALLFHYCVPRGSRFLMFMNHSHRHHVSLVSCQLEWAVSDRSSHEQIQVFWRRKQKSERQQKHLPPCLISALHSVPEMHTLHWDWNIFSSVSGITFRCFVKSVHAFWITKHNRRCDMKESGWISLTFLCV